MNADRYQRAKSIFFEACEQPREARERFVREACGEDSAMHGEVMHLLAHDDDPMTMIAGAGSPGDGAAAASTLREQLERLADSSAGDGVDTAGGSSAGASRTRENDFLPERIGRYRILGVLGEGGMGVVYRAEQENPRRQVALKVIARSQRSAQMLRRFEHEAQILGRLHHPGIAQVYEAGTHDEGRGAKPYFAMELVRGRPLLAFCESAGADRRTRLELFIAICDAVQHAHQQGVIHRDLKPANILVTESAPADSAKAAGRPAPKVLDFGVARITGSDIEVTTMHTAADQIIGTVAYMSPEQLGGRADDIDTRSDVYALGAILFEMLSGRLPHDIANRNIPESIRIIAEQEPSTLSSLDRACRGDLDTILRKALERDKSRRYQSAGELSADVRRFIRDEPIHARPPSSVYQFRKFAKRNKAMVGGAAAVFLALVAGIITTTWQAMAAIQARDEQQELRTAADTLADRARAEADKAQSVSEFLQRMLLAARPAVAQGRDLTVRQILDEAAEELDKTGRNLAPEVEGALRLTVARAYLSLELHEPAQPHLDRALARLREAYGTDHETVADCLEAMGRAARARGDWAGAEELTREALAVINRAAPGDHSLKAQILGSLAWVLPHFGRMQEAEDLLRQSLEITSRVYGPHAVETASVKIDLASVAHGDPVATEQMVLEAIDDIKVELGELHPAVARALNLLGAYRQMSGRLAEAEATYQQALDIRLQLFGPVAMETLDCVPLVAWAAQSQGEHERALALMVEYLPHARKAMRDDAEWLISYLARLSSCYAASGRPEEARAVMEEMVALCDAGARPNPPMFANLLGALALLIAETAADEDDEAMHVAERCLALPVEQAAANHFSRGDAMLARGLVLSRRGEFAAAETDLLQCERIFRSAERFRTRRDKAVRALVACYERWHEREPSPERLERLEQWRDALPDQGDQLPPESPNPPATATMIPVRSRTAYRIAGN